MRHVIGPNHSDHFGYANRGNGTEISNQSRIAFKISILVYHLTYFKDVNIFT